MKLIKRFLIKLTANLIPFDWAILGARFLMVSQGIGFAVEVDDSGELKALKKVVTKKNPIIFDVGGNIGHYSLAVLNMFRDAEVHTFEPSQAHFEQLKSRLGQFQNRCTMNMFGLSDQPKGLILHKNAEITGSATLCDKFAVVSELYCMEEQVSVKKGVDYLQEKGIEHIDYLKIDVEGWEMPVLKGFENLFSEKSVDFVQFEVTPHTMFRKECFWNFFDFFEAHDYRLCVIKPNGALRSINKNDEIFNSFYPTNYLAMSSKVSPPIV
ncbi:FkbM family methyltransferase [Luminiphilus sp.]|nr:FkbM family methyltransferase [Luminiphilus sp.]